MFSSFFGGSEPKETIYAELPSPKTPEDFKNVIDAAREKTLSLASSAGSEWVPVDTSSYPEGHGVTTDSKNDGSSAVECVRARKRLNASPKAVFDLVSTHDLKVRQSWDADVLDFKFLKDLDNGISIVYAIHNTPFPVTKRDLLLAVTHEQLADGKYLAFSTSINYAVNQDPNYVRAALYVSAWIIEPVEGNPDAADVIRVVQVDPKGMIPAFVVNANKAKPGLVMLEVEKQVAKK